MSETTGIAWTNATWNPWYGCTEVSAGCDHCYARRDMERYGKPWVVTRSKTKFREPVSWNEPKRVFTCSWSDWFHVDADPWRDEAWQVIRETPHHTYQVLTKRPGRIHRCLPADWGEGYPNVWLGVSIENQENSHRLRVLREIPARVRFVSAEPLLGPLALDLREVDWLIAGGESGPEHRAMDLDWARSLRDTCLAHGAKFFLKQLGGWPNARAHGKAILDGRTWTEVPA